MKGHQLKLGAVLSYISLGLNILVGLIYTPWLINCIGKSDYGLYTLAMSIIGLLAFDFGLSYATTKFVSQYLAHNRQDKVDNLLGMIFKLYLALDVLIILIFVVIFANLPEIYKGLTLQELSKFKIVFLIAASYCILSFPLIPLNGILTSYEKFIQLKSSDIIQRLIVITTMTICLICGYGLYALVIVNSVAGIICNLLKLYFIKKDTKVKTNFYFFNFSELKSVFNFTIWVTITTLCQRLIFNISPSILGIFRNSQEIAILGVAITIEGFVYLFANALNGMFLPKVSRILATESIDKVLELMIKIGRLQIYIIGFIITIAICFGSDFINLWIGNNYSLVYPCMLLLITPSFLHLPQEIGLSCIIASDKVKQQSIVYLIMGIGNILLSIPLAQKYGVIGICSSIFIVYIIRTIGIDFILLKVLHLDIFKFFKNSYLKITPWILIFLIIGISLNFAIKDYGILGLLLKTSIFCFIYMLCLSIFIFNKYEKDLILTPLIKSFHYIFK